MCKKRKKIRCPFCGYEMPIYFQDNAISKGLFTKCKGRNCRKEFEIKINDK